MTATRLPTRRRSLRHLGLGALLGLTLAACSGGDHQVVAVQLSVSGYGGWVGSEYRLAQGTACWTTAYAMYSDGTTQPVAVDWAESVPSVVSLAPVGPGTAEMTAVAPGATSVSATYGGVRGELAVQVY